MAWTYGFFNSVNGDRLYNAYQMSSIFEGLISNGVYESVGNKLAVRPNSGMTIQISTGRGWFNKHWVNNDSDIMLTLEGSDVILNRYCAVCIRVDDTDSGRKAEPYLKYSDFATTPVKPSMTRTETINEYCLAYVYIKAGATAITAADIIDTRSNQSLCGWVHGLIDQLDSNTLFEQYTAIFNEWFNGLQDVISGDVETTLVDAMPKSVTVTLNASSWSSNAQSVTVSGMNDTKGVIVQSNGANITEYTNAGIKCTGQSTNTLRFSCESVPTTNIKVDVLFMGE